ncbi:integrase family protein, partial [Escherichia coli]|nr:integrase family protein [Escherichia coli]
NYDDPDCVWRKRNPTLYEQNTLKLIGKVTELWSPVRAVALYLKLELPLRTYQVRMLDSGEADTWRYEHVIQGGRFVLNDSPLATGSDTRP